MIDFVLGTSRSTPIPQLNTITSKSERQKGRERDTATNGNEE